MSVFCAAAHNLGQLLAAAVLVARPSQGLEMTNLATRFLPVLLPAAVICGSLTGVLLNLLAPRLERGLQRWKNA